MPDRDAPQSTESPARRAGRGFTLIELVAVIVILAVLSALAVPRFINMSSNARIAAVQTAAGALFTAAMQANLKCRVSPACVDNGSGQSFVVGPDGSLNGLAYGYPTGRMPSSNGYWGISDWVVLDGFTATQVNLSSSDFQKTGAPDPSTCKISYSDAWGPNMLPSIVQTTTGC